MSQTVADDNEVMNVLLGQLIDRVKAMIEVWKDARSDEAKERIDRFVGYGLSSR